MTDRQIELIAKAKYLQDKIKILNDEVNKAQLEYIEVSNKLFDSIEDKPKVKEVLNGRLNK